jgi:hypothetical protein
MTEGATYSKPRASKAQREIFLPIFSFSVTMNVDGIKARMTSAAISRAGTGEIYFERGNRQPNGRNFSPERT